MKTRLAVLTVAVVLASSLACQRAKDNNLSDAVRNVPRMVEPVRDANMGARDSGKNVLIPPKLDAAEVHKKEVLESKILLVTQPKVKESRKKVKKTALEGIDDPDSRFAPKMKMELRGVRHEDVPLHH